MKKTKEPKLNIRKWQGGYELRIGMDYITWFNSRKAAVISKRFLEGSKRI